jgi:uncharacterized membrane protein YagU involved in acid resistance
MKSLEIHGGGTFGISGVLVVICCIIVTSFQDLNIGRSTLIGLFVFFGCHPHGTKCTICALP